MEKARFQLTVLDRFQLQGADGPINLGSKKICGLLAFLACSATPQPRERIMTLLWGSHFETQAQQNLRQAMSRLRRAVGDDVLLTTDHLVSIRPGAIELDADRFTTCVQDGSPSSLATAAEIYRTGFLADVSISEEGWGEWVRNERSRYERLALDALVRLGEAQIAAGEPARALETARRAAGIDELREDVHRVIIRALIATGRRAEALRQYEQLAANLKRELDVAPDPATQALVREARTTPAAAEIRSSPAEAISASGAHEIAAIQQEVRRDTRAVLYVDSNGRRAPAERERVVNICQRATADHHGRSVSVEGRGLVLEFPDTRTSAAAAFQIQSEVTATEAPLAPDQHLPVAMGIHLLPQGAQLADSLEAAQQLSRAAGGGIAVSAEAREHLTPLLDADVEDLGVFHPTAHNDLRAFRILPPTHQPSAFSYDSASTLWPTVAVIPFATSAEEPASQLLGDILADEIIAGLSHNNEVIVVSRLSTTALRGRDVPLHRIRTTLGATYVLSGSCLVSAGAVRLLLELADARSGNVLWAERFAATIADATAQGGIVDDVIGRLCAGIMNCETARARLQPLPTLENSSLLIGAVSLMHQLSLRSMDRAHDMLLALIERVPSHPMPHAWLAKLYLLRASQGWSPDFGSESERALDSSNRALDADPNCSLALAVAGYVQTHFLRRFDLAADRFELAVGINPNDSMAWLLKSTMHAFLGEGESAMSGAERALRLSPLDPRRWYYDSHAATAALAAGDYLRSIELAQRSLKANRTHTSTYRALTIAQSLAGNLDDARQTANQLMHLQPDFTVSQYRQRHPTGTLPIGQLWAKALKEAGVPE